MPRWINLSDDQKTRIVAPLVALETGGQLHLACDICFVKIPASDWQIASGYSTRTPRYSEVSMTYLWSEDFNELTGHPVVPEYEDKPLNLMSDWSKGLWKAEDTPANPFINLLKDRVSRGPRVISLHVQEPDRPKQVHTPSQMLSMPFDDYKTELQHMQDVVVPWEYKTQQHGELATLQAPMLTNQKDILPPPPPTDGDYETDMPIDYQNVLCDPSQVAFAYL